MTRVRRIVADPRIVNELRCRRLIAFLKTPDASFVLPGLGEVTRERAKELVRELIPTEIQVRGVAVGPSRAVIAAPHVSFDQWTEYFCNRLARAHGTGWVVALNFRDYDAYRIPVSIDRHLHVNRPTESKGAHQSETRTERAEQVFREYLEALARASGGGLPLDLLIELHAHRRSERIEIATSGVSMALAAELAESYAAESVGQAVPDLAIEPLHKVRLGAYLAKSIGSMHGGISRMSFHIEIPRGARATEPLRQRGLKLLVPLTARMIAAAGPGA